MICSFDDIEALRRYREGLSDAFSEELEALELEFVNKIAALTEKHDGPDYDERLLDYLAGSLLLFSECLFGDGFLRLSEKVRRIGKPEFDG